MMSMSSETMRGFNHTENRPGDNRGEETECSGVRHGRALLAQGVILNHAHHTHPR